MASVTTPRADGAGATWVAGVLEQTGVAGRPFPPDVVAAVLRHMTDDHAEDTLVLCRAAVPTATRARMTGSDTVGAAPRHALPRRPLLRPGRAGRAGAPRRRRRLLALPDLRPGDVRRGYRAGLDALTWGVEEEAELVGEVLVAYAHDRALAAALDAGLERWVDPT